MFQLFSARQIKDHFALLYLKEDVYLYDTRIAKQRIEFEREKLRKLKEVYQIAVDKTQNCRFFVRDFLEYIKKVMSMQLNVNKLQQEERLLLREKGFATGRIEGLLSQRVEGLERALFVLTITEPGSDPISCMGDTLELRLLQNLLPM